jgi:hypothetical protein
MRKNLKMIGALVAFGMLVLIMVVPAPSAQTWGSSSNHGGSHSEVIDYDNNANDEVWAVWHDGRPTSDPPGVELFRIQENGNVGIATDDPTEKLDVNGKTRIRNLPQDNTLDDVVVADADGVLHVRDVSTIVVMPNAWYGSSSGSPPADISDDIYTYGSVGVETDTPVTTLDVNGGFALNIVTVTGDYTPTGSDYTVLADASLNDVTINLPPAADVPGQILILKRADLNPSNHVVIYPDGSEHIDGRVRLGLNGRGMSYTLQSDGLDWYIIAFYRNIRTNFGESESH